MLVATIGSSALSWIILIMALGLFLFVVTIAVCHKKQNDLPVRTDDKDDDEEEDEEEDEDEDEEWNDEEDDDEFDEEDEALLLDAVLTGLALHRSFKKKDKKKKRNDWWETHCEYCGDPLEDCQCEHKHESHRDSGW